MRAADAERRRGPAPVARHQEGAGVAALGQALLLQVGELEEPRQRQHRAADEIWMRGEPRRVIDGLVQDRVPQERDSANSVHTTA